MLALLVPLTARWLVLARRFRAEARRMPTLQPTAWGDPASPVSSGHRPAPHVTVVLPARNEEATLAACLACLLAQQYPAFDVVVVDDRSDDATATILAATPGITWVAGQALPAGWVGKSWANWQGVHQARGEWLLFTDADTWHHPQALATAMGIALEQPEGLLTLSPLLVCGSFWERVVQPAVAFLMSELYPLAWREDPARPHALANGQYLLVRRGAYDAVGGHAAIAGAVVDDVTFAMLFKALGRPVRYMVGKQLLHVRMYADLGALWRGWRKGFVAPSAGPIWHLYLGSALQWTAESILPWLLLPFCRGWALAACLAVLTLTLAARQAKLRSYVELAPWWHLAHPLGVAVFTGLMLDALWLSARGRGAEWRGRTYARPS
ncbi:MAG: glycosyltransferase [Cyanobacteria bacterium RYN_339]|nr:glycosyltransferase [Cyanobacteria bacterium RYN_339]